VNLSALWLQSTEILKKEGGWAALRLW